MNITWNSKIFDISIADKPAYRYDGATGADAEGWVKRIEEYVVGKCPDLGPWMGWATNLGRTTPITGDVLQMAMQGQFQRCDVHVLNGHLWSLLGLCTTGAGKTLYRTAVPHSGLDVWRILRAFIGDRAPQRRQMLRDKLKTVPRAKNYGSIELAIIQWEQDRREYRECGGQDRPEEELKEQLMDMMPAELHKELIWKIHQYPSYSALREELIMKSKQWEYAAKRHGGVHMLGEDDGEADGIMQALSELEAKVPDLADICAMMRGRFQQKQGAKFTRRDRAPPKTAKTEQRSGDRKCANCGANHATSECKLPRVELADRKCFICNKKGHVASKCPDRKKLAGLMDHEDRPEGEHEELAPEDRVTMMLEVASDPSDPEMSIEKAMKILEDINEVIDNISVDDDETDDEMQDLCDSDDDNKDYTYEIVDDDVVVVVLTHVSSAPTMLSLSLTQV
jgi:hypothetical protein